jgi:hypothetical protein
VCPQVAYDSYGYDSYGYDKSGYDKYGYAKDGYHKDGYDRWVIATFASGTTAATACAGALEVFRALTSQQHASVTPRQWQR